MIFQTFQFVESLLSTNLWKVYFPQCGNVDLRSKTALTEHPQVRGKNVQRKIRTRLDFLSIPQSVGENVKTFRWDQRLLLLNSIQYLLFRTIQGKETNFRVYKLIQNKVQK